jgi:hypothetical protein
LRYSGDDIVVVVERMSLWRCREVGASSVSMMNLTAAAACEMEV